MGIEKKVGSNVAKWFKVPRKGLRQALNTIYLEMLMVKISFYKFFSKVLSFC